MRSAVIKTVCSLMLAVPGLASEPPRREPHTTAEETFAIDHARLLDAADDALLVVVLPSPLPAEKRPERMAHTFD